MHTELFSRLLRAAAILMLIPAVTMPLSAGAAEAEAPGCDVRSPDAHMLAGPRVGLHYLFSCDNPRIRYVKVTVAIRRDRGGWSDAVVEHYQFDRFRDPGRAGVDAWLVVDHDCAKGKKYHGDITVNSMLNGDQMGTTSRRGDSVTCR